MLIAKPKFVHIEKQLNETQKMALEFLPKEQVTKFSDFPELLEDELMNEARQPELENTMKDLFDALHEKNIPKLLKTLQGDKRKIFYAFKKQLQTAQRLTKSQAKMLQLISSKEVSLFTIALIK